VLAHLTDASPSTSLDPVKSWCPGRELAPPPGA
jgi:hypothetical protein